MAKKKEEAVEAEVIEQETTQVPAVVESNAIVNIEDYAMGVEEQAKRVAVVHTAMKDVMKENTHYGVIPGTSGKPSLLKPGAEILATTFRMATEFDINRTDHPNFHREYEVTCTLTHAPTGQYLGQGVGSCSSMEGKYRFRKGSLSCPECGTEAIIKGKQEYGGGWLCFAKKGGCGEKWSDDDNPFKGKDVGKVEHDNPADYYNTVLKMAKKRAFVDAVITVSAASDIFTQDVEDLPRMGQSTQTGQKSSSGGAQAQQQSFDRLNTKEEALALMAKESVPEEWATEYLCSVGAKVDGPDDYNQQTWHFLGFKDNLGKIKKYAKDNDLPPF